jgi:hypothetical protein
MYPRVRNAALRDGGYMESRMVRKILNPREMVCQKS